MILKIEKNIERQHLYIYIFCYNISVKFRDKLYIILFPEARSKMNIFSFKYRNLILGVTATAVGYYAVLTPHTIFLSKYRYMVARYYE